MVSYDLGSGTGSKSAIRAYSCFYNKKQYHVETDKRCGMGDCIEVENELLSFCNNEYKTNLKITDTSQYLLAYAEAAAMEGDYVAASVRCHAPGQDKWYTMTPTSVFLRKQNNSWKYYFMQDSSFSCGQIDNKEVPVEITGTCYDSKTTKYRTPLNGS